MLASEKEKLNAIEIALEPYAQAISTFEIQNSLLWRVEGYCHDEAGNKNLEAEIRATLLPHVQSDITFEVLPEEDWLTKSYEGFPPIEAGRFFVHGSHFNGIRPADKIPLLINAATAFGSGEHQTTYGCLVAMTDLSTHFKPHHILDMGTGSGILAFAAAKLWHRPVLGIDIDHESVRVARENAQMNGLENEVRFQVGQGFKTLITAQKYDLITANILANPLCAMARELISRTADNGYIILSGILNTQANQVKNTYRDQGTHLIHDYHFGEWTTLLLKKVVR